MLGNVSSGITGISQGDSTNCNASAIRPDVYATIAGAVDFGDEAPPPHATVTLRRPILLFVE
jgi:hypothetical protein